MRFLPRSVVCCRSSDHFKRFHTNSAWAKPCPGVDEVGFVYVSASSVSAVTSRFWLVVRDKWSAIDDPHDLQGVPAIGREYESAYGVGAKNGNLGPVRLDAVVEKQRPGSDELIFDGLWLSESATCYQDSPQRGRSHHFKEAATVHRCLPFRVLPTS
jgi:hypothetical protein